MSCSLYRETGVSCQLRALKKAYQGCVVVDCSSSARGTSHLHGSLRTVHRRANCEAQYKTGQIKIEFNDYDDKILSQNYREVNLDGPLLKIVQEVHAGSIEARRMNHLLHNLNIGLLRREKSLNDVGG